jgi:hypothetical protein
MSRKRFDSSKVTARASAPRLRRPRTGKAGLSADAVREFLDAYIVWRETRPVSTIDLDRREHEAVRTLEFLADSGGAFRELILSASQSVASQLRSILKEIHDLASWDGAPQKQVVINTDGLLFAEICAALNRSGESGNVYHPPDAGHAALEPLP